MKGYWKNKQISTSELVKEILQAIKKGEVIDIYEKLLKAGTLSSSELRRPIFAYMVYQLMINNVDFLSVGKIGIYLSFINLLTKEAKYMDDCSLKVDLKEEFAFRNLLHAIAALWMYQRQQGKQGILKKADIYRVLDGEKISGESDEETLRRFKNKGVTEVHFLSHSYFGEKDRNLHFHHQSFAEILLAEYYLKVFIKYALDKEQSMEEARPKLLLGEPTRQTVEFFKEMLELLKQSAASECTTEVLEKRKLLFPLFASIATVKNNKFYSTHIDYTWFRDCELGENQTQYPQESLKKWCIGQKEIERIVALARSIIDSETSYVLARVDVKKSLYNKDVLAFQKTKLNESPPDIDRWLALLVGNVLHNDQSTRTFFNGTLENCHHLFDLIRNWHYFDQTPSPNWGRWLFQGIDLRQSQGTISLEYHSLAGLDFSFSKLYQLDLSDSDLAECVFNHVIFSNVSLNDCHILDTSFHNIKILGFFNISDIRVAWGVCLPRQCAERIGYHSDEHYEGMQIIGAKVLVGKDIGLIWDEFIRPLFGLLSFGLKKNLFSIDEIKSWYKFDKLEDEYRFHKELGQLAEKLGVNYQLNLPTFQVDQIPEIG